MFWHSTTRSKALSNRITPNYRRLSLKPCDAPVEAWNIFTLGDSDLAELDAIRLGPQEQRGAIDTIDAARPILVQAALDRSITTEQAGKVVAASLKAASEPIDNINTRQAQSLAQGTSKNLVGEIVRRAYLFCQDLVDPKTDEARELVSEYRKGVAKAAGAATVAAVSASALYAVSFFEFVCAHAVEIKGYFAVVFQNAQLQQVIDAIVYTHGKLRE